MTKSEVNWSEVHRRINAVNLQLARENIPGDEKKKSILRARADALARKAGPEKTDGEQVEVVEFVLAHERYGIESAFVREIYPLKEFTPMPGTPPFVIGVINLRGELISLVDIKKFFDLPEHGITDLNKVIVLKNAVMEFGILADSVEGARKISISELQPTPPTFTGSREKYSRGITAERAAILDAARLLSDPKLVINGEISNPAKRIL